MTEGFDPLQGLRSHDLRPKVIALLGPLPRFIVWARSVCKTWRAWIPEPELRGDSESWRLYSSAKKRYLVQRRSWTLGATLSHLVLREPDHCAANMCFVLQRYLTDPSVSAKKHRHTSVVDDREVCTQALLLAAVKNGKVTFLELLLRCAVLCSSGKASPVLKLLESLPQKIMDLAVRHNRLDVLYAFRHLLWSLPRDRRMELFSLALHRSNSATFSCLLDLDVVNVRDVSVNESFSASDLDVVGIEFCKNIRVLSERGAPPVFFDLWFAMAKSHRHNRPEATVVLLLRAAIAVCITLRQNSVELCSYLETNHYDELHHSLSDWCGCVIVNDVPRAVDAEVEDAPLPSDHDNDDEEEDEEEQDEDEDADMYPFDDADEVQIVHNGVTPLKRIIGDSIRDKQDRAEARAKRYKRAMKHFVGEGDF